MNSSNKPDTIMKHQAHARLLVIVLLLLVSGCGSGKEGKSPSSQNQNQEEASYVENASFTDLEGNPVSVSDFRGKVVLIDFWETWCKPCLASFPTMQKLLEDYPDRFMVLAVTPGFTDTREDARQFARAHDYDFVYLYDKNKLHQKLNVQGIPFKVFVDAQGDFVEMSMGSSGPEGDYNHAKEIIEEHGRS